MTIDSEICKIGSTNIDICNFSVNYELNVVVYSALVAKKLEKDFERDLAACTTFDLAEHQKSNVVVRFRNSVARLFSPVL